MLSDVFCNCGSPFFAGGVTVTDTGTSSVDPSGYLTRTFPVILSPGFDPSGIVTVTFPSLSTVITPGLSLSNVVPSGIFLHFLLLMEFPL